MKSFAKAFRATLSIALVLCMVMSFVTVSADGTAVSVTQVENSLKYLNDGYYEVEFEVSGITAADADATIMVYSGETISKDTIKYANQKDVAEGSESATFKMEVPAGIYNIKAGGTGAAAGTGTLDANEAPVFTGSSSRTAELKADAGVGTVVVENIVATDAEGQNIEYTLTGSDLFDYNAGNIVVAKELSIGEYTLILTAFDGFESATATIAVDVKAATIVVGEFTYDSKGITVDYGTSELTFPEIKFGDVVFEASWSCEKEFNALVAGNYTFVAKVSPKDGYNIEGAAAPTITVNVKKAVIDKFEDNDPITVDYGTLEANLDLPATVTASGFVFEVEDWVCDKEYTATEGVYTFTAVLKDNANCEVAEGAKATVVVNVGKKPAEKVTIDEFDTVVLSGEFYVGTNEEDILKVLAEKKVYGYDADGKEYGPFTITWTADAFAPDSTEPQKITGTINVISTSEYEYIVEDNGIEVTVQLKPYTGNFDPNLGVIYVTDKTEYEDLDLPETVEVTYGEKTHPAEITWPEVDWMPPAVGEPKELVASGIVLPEYIKYSGGMPYFTIARVSDKATVKVNGKDNEDGIIVAKGSDIKVEIVYEDVSILGHKAEYTYEYEVKTLDGEAVEDGVVIDEESGIIKLTKADLGNRYLIYGYVKLGDENAAEDSMLIYVASSTVSGSVYVNTNAEKTYSALRVNRNADSFVVTTSFKNYNGDELSGTFEYALVEYSSDDVVAENENGIFTKEDYADCNGAYRVIVKYTEDGKELHSAGRTIYITDKALWYTDMTINGKTGSGIVVKKANDIKHAYTLSDLGADGTVYTGSEVVSYSANPSGNATLNPVVNVAVENNVALDGFDNGAYTLYALAKLTEGQPFYDMVVGRTVYVKDTITTVCNVLLNGSTNCVPAFDEDVDVLTIKPYWARGAIVEPTTTYTAEISTYDPETKTWSEYAVVECSEDGTCEVNKSEFKLKNKVKYTMYVNGETTPDASIEKIFYVK